MLMNIPARSILLLPSFACLSSLNGFSEIQSIFHIDVKLFEFVPILDSSVFF
jgi:hypothetical protein